MELIELCRLTATRLGMKLSQVQATVNLLEEGNTVPFITRYRKEMTGGLDEEEIRRIEEGLNTVRQLEDRRQSVLESIESQGKLDDELRARILACDTLTTLEDLYLPYRPKRKTRAGEARRRGLAPLAACLLSRCRPGRPWLQELSEWGEVENPLSAERITELAKCDTAEEAAKAFCLHEEVADLLDALAGARDIVAELINEDAQLRATLRDAGQKRVSLQSKLADPAHAEAGRFTMYHDFGESLATLPPHRILALNRGESLGVLQLKLAWDSIDPQHIVEQAWLTRPADPWAGEIREAIADGLARLLLPALGRDLRRELSERAEDHSLVLFATNLRQLLLQPPLNGKRILGIDPGYRTGCKVAAIDEQGHYLEGGTIYPHPPQNKAMEAKLLLLEMVRKHRVDVVAIGNGTAGRETEELVAELIGENQLELRFTVVDEAGASVYSASEEAREEFPALDATQRGNISIARRLLDPLAELVKIDPRSLGVGQYQHDVDAKRLGERLEQVVESCVNHVGVDLNTASASLLRRVAGVTRRVGTAIVEHRSEHGPFTNRRQLLQVRGLGPAAFQQCAGFLRIREGEQALDNTAVHPESYSAVEELARSFGMNELEPLSLAASIDRRLHGESNLAELAASVGLGVPTLTDILAELRKPGRDPREELDPPPMRGGITRLEDLHPGTVLDGVVRNIVDFGAFVDVGLKNDGLIHVSQISHRRINHPSDVLQVGQRLKVSVLEVDHARGRISLSLKALEEPPAHRPRSGGREHRPERQREDRQRQEPPRPGSIGAILQDKARRRNK